MNISTFTNNGLTARVFAGITLLSLLLSAFPVAFFVAEAATGIDGESFTIDIDNDEYTATADTTGLENIVLTFNYDVSALDGDDENIVISYSAGGDSDTQTINGSTGDTAVAGDQGLITLTGLSADATLAISISADVSSFSGPASDSIELTNITVTGDPVTDVPDDVDTSEETNGVQGVDFCDPSQKPGGKSIAQWHADNQFDGSNCFNYEVTSQCGTLDVQINQNQTPYDYAFYYVIGSETPELANFEGDGPLPVDFDEDANNGSVNVTYYVVGAEKDYFTGSDVPNIWDGTGTTVTIDTNCHNDEPELEIPQQCSVVADELVVSADSSAGTDTNVTLDNGRDYFAVVEGTYTFGSPKNGNERLADAEYSLDAGETEWVKVFEAARPDVLDLFIDGVNPDFGAFRSNHTYGAYFLGTGATSNFAIQDNPHSDNSGELVVTIYECDPEPVLNLHTQKIICEDESELPNGSVAKPITANTAQAWVDQTNTCEIVDGWEFEWADKSTSDPGDTLVGSAGSDWTTFTGSTEVPLAVVNEQSFWVREVLQEEYIPFTHGPEGGNSNDVTAEMYCHTDVRNFDNYDRVDSPVDDGDYYCVAWNVKKTSDVSICKENYETEERLNGWQLALLGDKVGETTVAPDGDEYEITGVPAGDYVLKASDAYVYRPVNLRADAAFSARKIGDVGFGSYPFQPWRITQTPNQHLGVKVNGDALVWGNTFNPAHVYYTNWNPTNATNTGTFQITDDHYKDNSGSILMEAFYGYTGITSENGCVIFEDVPYGDYEIEELLQIDWQNVSGLGPITVDEAIETFTVANLEPQDPNKPMVELSTSKIICNYEDELPNWGDGTHDVDATTAADWLASHEDTSCRLVSDWEFEWGTESAKWQSGDFIGPAGSDWTTFAGNVSIPASALAETNLKVREVQKEGYIPFGDRKNDVSAELYCHTDGLNYDNGERINKPKADTTYHCVAWNVPEVPPVTSCKLDIYSDTTTVVKDTNGQAVATYDGNDRWTANIANAIWVWATNQVANPESDETYTFVETFTVTNPTLAHISIAHDNWMTLKVNETEFVRNYNGYQEFQKLEEDILSAVQSGENRIEMTVTNLGIDNSNYMQNPAGALFHIEVEGDIGSCERTTEPTFPGSLAITNPAENDQELSGTFQFMADYQDADEDEDTVFWAIRAGSCSGTDVVGNAPASPTPNNPSTFNPVTGEFETTVDMSTWDNGDYCLVVNPREDDGAEDLRATRIFNLQNEDSEPQRYTISGFKWDDENGNGFYDEAVSESESGEDTISGWVISLLQDGAVVATTTTDETGAYSFEVEPGVWAVSEEEITGWTQTGLYENGDPVSLTSQGSGSCNLTIPEDGQVVDFYTCSFGNQEDETTDTPVDPEIERPSGGSGSTATRIDRVNAPTPLVLGATTDASQFCPFLTEFMQIGAENDKMEVMKLQLFLNVFRDTYGGTENPITGTFGSITDANVKAFQDTYRSEVLDPWFVRGIVPHDRPTGYVYKTTLWKINSIVCPDYVTEPDFTGESLDANVDNNINDIVRD